MKVFVITDAKGRFVSAWPKVGIANIHCRTELKDKVTQEWCTHAESSLRQPPARKPPKKTRKGAKK